VLHIRRSTFIQFFFGILNPSPHPVRCYLVLFRIFLSQSIIYHPSIPASSICFALSLVLFLAYSAEPPHTLPQVFSLHFICTVNRTSWNPLLSLALRQNVPSHLIVYRFSLLTIKKKIEWHYLNGRIARFTKVILPCRAFFLTVPR